VRGFLLGLSISLAFIVGALFSNYLLPLAAARAATGGATPPAPPPAPPRAAPGASASHPSAPELDAPSLVAPIPKWEYICYRAELTHKLVEVANQAGEDGWEMVGTDGQGPRPSIWCFKRRKNAQVEP
jgi:hypothetical protein